MLISGGGGSRGKSSVIGGSLRAIGNSRLFAILCLVYAQKNILLFRKKPLLGTLKRIYSLVYIYIYIFF